MAATEGGDRSPGWSHSVSAMRQSHPAVDGTGAPPAQTTPAGVLGPRGSAMAKEEALDHADTAVVEWHTMFDADAGYALLEEIWTALRLETRPDREAHRPIRRTDASGHDMGL